MDARIGLTIGYLIAMLLQSLLIECCFAWWLFQLGFLLAIHLVWWLVVIIKRKYNDK